jgi:hypothetical protein
MGALFRGHDSLQIRVLCGLLNRLDIIPDGPRITPKVVRISMVKRRFWFGYRVKVEGNPIY